MKLKRKNSKRSADDRIVFGDEESAMHKDLAKSMVKDRTGMEVQEPETLKKSILKVLNGTGNVERLAFEVDPSTKNSYQAIYQSKMRLIPDPLLKRIAIQDDLVATIVRARQNHLASFGRPRPDRFSTGYMLQPKTGVYDRLDQEGKEKLNGQIERAIKLIWNCGHTDGIGSDEYCTFSEYLSLSVRSAVVVGRLATEVIWRNGAGGKKEFHSFRATDAGTIYKSTKDKVAADSVRRDAFAQLKAIKDPNGPKPNLSHFNEDSWEKENYSWVQVIEGRPVQAFTSDEMKVYNFYPVPDVELSGYPVTPIDSMITAVTTHINITTHNKLYFQSGRATRGMLVIKSDDATPNVVHNIKQQFNASINNVNNSWRMPVFGCGSEDDISWQTLDGGASRDMEFQYLTDMNARVILSAFMMSPDELPGWAYLSKGTNNQSLAECISGDSKIWIKENGSQKIKDFLGASEERFGTFWSGKSWVKGRAFRSGRKILARTELSCGVEIDTSPDHRFRIVGPDGTPVWKRQEDLVIGDYVLVNKKPISGSLELVPVFNGKKLTPEMAEILGWIIGHGNVSPPKKGIHGACISSFYHHTKETDIRKRHAQIMQSWGLDVQHKEELVPLDEQEKIKKRYGFKNTAPVRLRNYIYNSSFYDWLNKYGFVSKNKKTIPQILFSLPLEIRAAFLKGLFSADGHATSNGAVVLTVQDQDIRNSVRELLLSLGIRTLNCKGFSRESFGKKEFSYKLFIKDREEFWKYINFSQPHKQDRYREGRNNDRPALELTKALADSCFKTEAFYKLKKSKKDYLVAASKGGRISYKKLREYADLCGCDNEILDNYHVEKVTAISTSTDKIEMFDVEMFDDVHCFAVNGVMTHNSNNEYKMQAARDLGIRPLLSSFEDFLNSTILPLIDPELSKLVDLRLVGLDSENQEKEAIRLQQDIPLHMTYDEVLERVEKQVLGPEWGGRLPLNPTVKQYIDELFTVGQILEKFCGVEGASKDPELNYRRDPYWFQQMQLIQAQQQMEMQAQQIQVQEQAPEGQEGEETSGRTESEDQRAEESRQAQEESQQDLGANIDAAAQYMEKSEASLPPNKRMILHLQEKAQNVLLDHWKTDMKDVEKEILAAIKDDIK